MLKDIGSVRRPSITHHAIYRPETKICTSMRCWVDKQRCKVAEATTGDAIGGKSACEYYNDQDPGDSVGSKGAFMYRIGGCGSSTASMLTSAIDFLTQNDTCLL
jgi:hypothetical protein